MQHQEDEGRRRAARGTCRDNAFEHLHDEATCAAPPCIGFDSVLQTIHDPRARGVPPCARCDNARVCADGGFAAGRAKPAFNLGMDVADGVGGGGT